MSKTRKWLRYIAITLLTAAPWLGYYAWFNYYLDHRGVVREWVEWTALMPFALILVTGVIVGLSTTAFFWLWLFGPVEREVIVKDTRGSDPR